MDPEVWARIRQLRREHNLSLRTIAARLHVSRKTIKRALVCDKPPPLRARPATEQSRKLDPFKLHIKRLLADFPDMPAVRIREEIAKLGYQGGITILREYLAVQRPRKAREPFLRIETAPGKEAQVNSAHFGTIGEGDDRRKLSCFIMVLSHSRMIYLEWTVSQQLDDFLRCHQHAFLFFGGIPAKILYDNLKSVVLERIGNHIRFNERFLTFADWYGFVPVPCRPRRGNEKGKVERAIGYIRTSFFPGRIVSTIEDLNAQAIAWRDEVANCRIHHTLRQRPIDRYQAEKPLLRRLPEHPFDCDTLHIVAVSKDLFVVFDTNHYSVPASCAGLSLRLRANNSLVRIYNGDALVASHPRSLLKHQFIQDPAHVEPVKDFKKMIGTSKQLDAFTSLGPNAKGFIEGLVKHQKQPLHHVEKILALAETHGAPAVDAALGRCTAHYVFDWNMVRHLVETVAARKPVRVPSLGLFPDIDVASTNLADYDDSFRNDDDQGNRP